MVSLVDFGLGLVVGGLLVGAIWQMCRASRRGPATETQEQRELPDRTNETDRQEKHRTMWD